MTRPRNGFTLIELVIAVSLILVMAGLAMPLGLSYWRGAEVTSAAQEVKAILSLARSEAVRQNQPVRLTLAADGFQMWQCTDGVACTLPVLLWRPKGQDVRYNESNGQFVIFDTIGDAARTQTGTYLLFANTVTITGSAAPIFTPLGAATAGVTYTVTSRKTGTTIPVRLTAAGRAKICRVAPAPCTDVSP